MKLGVLSLDKHANVVYDAMNNSVRNATGAWLLCMNAGMS